MEAMRLVQVDRDPRDSLREHPVQTSSTHRTVYCSRRNLHGSVAGCRAGSRVRHGCRRDRGSSPLPRQQGRMRDRGSRVRGRWRPTAAEGWRGRSRAADRRTGHVVRSNVVEATFSHPARFDDLARQGVVMLRENPDRFAATSVRTLEAACEGHLRRVFGFASRSRTDACLRWGGGLPSGG